MILREQVPLSSLTTLRVGGSARYVAPCTSEAEVRVALAFARAEHLPWRVLGQGSNVLAADNGFAGVLLQMLVPGVSSEERGDKVVITAGAGVPWDELVEEAARRGLWGLENLAGIPGTVGAAPVQNIGAYGSEVKDTLTEVRALDTDTGEIREFSSETCAFGYRDSLFKREPKYVILSVSFVLSRTGSASLGYKDLQAAKERGADLATPAAVGKEVRAIRARKFPDLGTHGTAGSFFKNPTITHAAYEELTAKYPAMPGFKSDEGVKVPLAFVLDKVLGLRGHRVGHVWLYSEQPLVLVADSGARAQDIDVFANDIAARVYAATGIRIEREVRAFP